MQRYASPGLPIPAVVALGWDEGFHWCVSVRCEGRLLSDVSGAATEHLTSQVCDVLDALAAADISGTSGYGYVGADGSGSWREFVRSAAFRKDGERDLSALGSAATAEDRSFVAACQARMAALEDALPEERVLLHGDFTAANLLHDGSGITGVIDWTAARYGDPLFDVAWFDLQYPAFGLPRVYLQRRPTSGADERLEYYRLMSAAFIIGFLGHLGEHADRVRCLEKWSSWF